MVNRNCTNRAADRTCGDEGKRESLSGDGSDGTFVMHDLLLDGKGYSMIRMMQQQT
jgi:hypothetical protein